MKLIVLSIDTNRKEKFDYKDTGSSCLILRLLNLPVSIIVAGKGTVSFLYDANGTKLKRQLPTIPFVLHKQR